MTGGLLQLAAYGAQDIHLSGNPQITFFIAVYKRYTNFAIENVQQLFTGNANFGQKVYCDIERVGDLMNTIFVRIDLPSLKEFEQYDSNNEIIKYYWVNSIGNAIIKYTDIEIGGTIIDKQYGLWLEIWGELTVDTNKRIGYYEMIGKSENPINLQNENKLSLYIPLYFWFCRNIGLSLPLIALQSHEVRINMAFRELNELIISSNGKPLEPILANAISITHASLLVDYIFLEDKERKFFAQCEHEYLIEQLQVNVQSLYSNKIKDKPQGYGFDKTVEQDHIISLDFNHPVKELIWVLQNSTVLSMYPYGGNEWFNFSTEPYNMNDSYSHNAEDPMIHARITFEGSDRMHQREAKYYRLVTPYQRHTNIPNNYIYIYSFAIRPEDFQPTGTCNFSRIDNKNIYIRISDKLVDPIMTVFATNYNILKINSGMAGIQYSN